MIDVRFEKPAGLTAAWVKRWVGTTLLHEKVTHHSLNVLVTGDRQIRRINKKFLDHDRATDVISFSSEESYLRGQGLIGDIVVSVDTARRVSGELGIPFKEELARYLVHGTLHLLGYDDKKKKDFKKMHKRQEEIIMSLRAPKGRSNLKR